MRSGRDPMGSFDSCVFSIAVSGSLDRWDRVIYNHPRTARTTSGI